MERGVQQHLRKGEGVQQVAELHLYAAIRGD